MILPRQLDYFLMVYRKGSIAAAAQAIPLTPQGVKKSLSTLEATLGAPLFEEGRDRQPTPYGDALFELACSWERDDKQFDSLIAQLKLNGRRPLSAAVVTGWAETLESDFVGQFNAKNPEVLLEVTECTNSVAVEKLLSSEVNVAFLLDADYEGISIAPLVQSSSCVWVNREHPLAQRAFLNLSDLDNEAIMIPDEHFISHFYYRDQFAQHGVRPKTLGYYSDPMLPIMVAVRGEALGLSAQYLADALGPLGKTVAIPLEGGFEHVYGVAVRSGETPSADEQQLIDFFLSTYQSAGRARH